MHTTPTPLRPEPTAYEPRVIAVTSGKGGVGKSVISANVAVACASQGRRVLLIDADLALANLDLLLGVEARYTVRDVLDGKASIEEAIVEGPRGVSLLAACSGDVELAALGGKARMNLFDAIDSLEQRYDTVIVDTGAGVGSNATGFASAAQQVVVVVTPDPTSMADAYAMIKVLSQRCHVERVSLVVNQASGAVEADSVVDRLVALTQRFLDVTVVPVGFVYADAAVSRSVRACEPLVSSLPSTSASSSLRALAKRLLSEPTPPHGSVAAGPSLFWERLMGVDEAEGRDGGQ